MSKNTILRLLVFFIGIPLLAVSAFFGRHQGLPIFGALVIAASALAAHEAAFFFAPSTRDYPGARVIIPLLGAAVPSVGYLSALFSHSGVLSGLGASALVVPTITLGAAIILAVQVLRRTAGEISHIVQVVSAHLFLLVYPGLFTWHAARLVSLEANSELILVFLLAVYLNDSMAWLFGRLFGHHEQTHRSGPAVAVSPNKSWTGFVAGFLASIAVVGLTGRLWPAILPGPTVLHLILGAVVGLAAITGDLVESGLKRSAAVKDSGQLIPGRGGLLDSIDSALFTAPFFYYGVVILYAL